MIGYDRGFREHPQPDWVTATPEMRFKYGSIGAEHDAGVPYWIFYVLPRVFPEKFVQDGQVAPGGFAALGVALGDRARNCRSASPRRPSASPRVANNCAVCHTTSYRATAGRQPGLRRRRLGPHRPTSRPSSGCSSTAPRDPRFNADILMAEINRVTHLDCDRPACSTAS
jgi:hypothetical protein